MNMKRLNELVERVLSDRDFVVRVNERAMRGRQYEIPRGVHFVVGRVFGRYTGQEPTVHRLSLDEIRRHYSDAITRVNSKKLRTETDNKQARAA